MASVQMHVLCVRFTTLSSCTVVLLRYTSKLRAYTPHLSGFVIVSISWYVINLWCATYDIEELYETGVLCSIRS